MSVDKDWPFKTVEYEQIARFYGNRTAERSKVPLIQHIHEGVQVMQHIDASMAAIRAYMIHPLFQNEMELLNLGKLIALELSPYVVMLAMEYRNQANKWLSPKVTKSHDGVLRVADWPTSGPLPEVRDMLIADKIQNYKDFRIHHFGTHKRSDQLNEYFNIWHRELGLDEARVKELVDLITGPVNENQTA